MSLTKNGCLGGGTFVIFVWETTRKKIEMSYLYQNQRFPPTIIHYWPLVTDFLCTVNTAKSLYAPVEYDENYTKFKFTTASIRETTSFPDHSTCKGFHHTYKSGVWWLRAHKHIMSITLFVQGSDSKSFIINITSKQVSFSKLYYMI